MIKVDKLAVVNKSAEIGDNCVIGPFCTVGPHTRIGPNTTLRSHVLVEPYTVIGENCDVFPFVTLGIQSQDQKYVKGTVTFTEIGARNVIREFVSIHSGTFEGSKTTVGNDCALLAQSHVAHNCTVGNHVVLSHSVALGGHVTIGDHANIGGLSAIHQFCHVGRAGMLAGMSRLTQDVLPFTIAEGFPAHMRVINKVGMERAGYSSDDMKEVRKAFRILFLRGLRLEEAVNQVKQEFPTSDNVQLMLEAINSSQKGLARPESDTYEINMGDDDD
ncbi:MAG: acyl-ACP--UDP-N-acetylglucosamine O-acyltransferase [Proteobacteria bacterium]|jgi:UDP-N-acetylglucosamine acyltransferase|nr:acyl-ACP--UDP-N-acetylglucosamine O-acyltransferase [Pseudomonadota bacterium]MDA1299998.1 acyl-ACP--UDP-N-acetylglucosamine O-acyltransferase [Pseudomonadota bacterium]